MQSSVLFDIARLYDTSSWNSLGGVASHQTVGVAMRTTNSRRWLFKDIRNVAGASETPFSTYTSRTWHLALCRARSEHTESRVGRRWKARSEEKKKKRKERRDVDTLNVLLKTQRMKLYTKTSQYSPSLQFRSRQDVRKKDQE